MSLKLFLDAILKFALGVVLVSVLLFLPAGTLFFWQGWLFMGVLFIPMFVAGSVMMLVNPALLVKRLDAKEKQKDQDVVVKLSGLMFLVGFVLAGLGHRFGWYVLPAGVSIGATIIFVLAYLLYAEVLRENTYLSRTIEVQGDQKIVDTGLYGIVRHPMYAVTVWLFLSIPVVLGSWWSFLCFLPYVAVIVVRIQNEEKVLETGLCGYSEYKKRVKYRLLPLIW